MKTEIEIEKMTPDEMMAELRGREAEANARLRKHEQSEARKQQELYEYALKVFNRNLFVSLNGEGIKKVDELVFKCPACGEPLPGVRGFVLEMAGYHKQMGGVPVPLTNPLSDVMALPCRNGSVKCKNAHVNQVLIQMLL